MRDSIGHQNAGTLQELRARGKRMLKTVLAVMALAALAATFVPALAQQQKAPVAPKAATQPKPQPQPGVTGTWTGLVRQVGTAKGYQIAMTIHANGGDTDYPELACGGRLTRVASSGGYTFFLETITRGRLDKGGRCIDGSVTISMAGEQLSWGWVGSHKDQTIVAYSMLMRR
jgi:hypothetical protein